MRTSPLLINESPLQTLPSLARLVGLNSAIILQQIHYWLNASEHIIEGETWIYNSYKKWAKQFTWLTPRAIQKHILHLEREGYLISRQFKYRTGNNTKWYRIDFNHLHLMCEKQMDGDKSNSLLKQDYVGEDNIPDSEDSHHDSASLEHKSCLKSEQNTQENTHKTTTEDNSIIFTTYSDEIDELTPMITERLKDAIKIFPPDWIVDAIKEAVLNKVKKWNYIEAILKSWAKDGRQGKKSTGRADRDEEGYFDGGKYQGLVNR